ncbi:MAG: iron-containing alcohol dehydrogenase [Aliarcobacter sp.]|jgi:NADP-dependent alcohol dehydrogenase|nr:iron-containing alcohol dehydrogenase [Aliarcobacter sp.]MDX9902094.1 iron-containing alcohol dehydrogenase [Aliarcobacter sp.]
MEFSYDNPTAIEFGKGKIKELSNKICKDKKILLVYGGGSIKNNGVYDQVVKALENHTYIEFSGVEVNPTVETMNKAVKIIKEENIDFILAVGGGSVIDGCKYLAAAALYDGDGWDFLDGTAEVEKALPLGVVLTLAATGSETNNLTVVSKKETDEKRMYFSNFSYPKFAIMDPSVMATLSDRQLGNGLVDAFVHTSEQYITYPTPALVNDGYAETLFRSLVKLADTWEDRRTDTWLENLMHIANQALNFQIGAGVPQDWSTHLIGHELTAYYKLDHARSLAVVQPYLLEVMGEDKKEKIAQLGKNVFGIENDNTAVIKAMEAVYNKVGVPTKLSEYEIDDKVISNVKAALIKNGYTQMGENANITLDKVETILTMSMNA